MYDISISKVKCIAEAAEKVRRALDLLTATSEIRNNDINMLFCRLTASDAIERYFITALIAIDGAADTAAEELLWNRATKRLCKRSQS